MSLAVIPVLFTGLFIGIMIGLPVFNITIRARLLRLITKRNYGIVTMRMKGRTLFRTLKNLDKDLLHFRKGVYLLLNSSIYKVAEDGIKPHQSIEPSKVHFSATVPEIFLDVEDLAPLELARQKLVDKATQNPTELEAVMSKEIALNDAENLRNKKDKLQKMIVISIIVSVICIIAIALLYIQFQNLHFPELTSKINELLSLARGE